MMKTQQRIFICSTSFFSTISTASSSFPRALRSNRHTEQLRIQLRCVLPGDPFRRHQIERLHRSHAGLPTSLSATSTAVRLVTSVTVTVGVRVIWHESINIIAERSHLRELFRQLNVLFPKPLVLVDELRRCERRWRVRWYHLLLAGVRRRNDRNRSQRHRRRNSNRRRSRRRQRRRRRRQRDLPPLNFAQKPLLATAETLVREFPPIRYDLPESLQIRQKRKRKLGKQIKISRNKKSEVIELKWIT